ncbi:MAG TPA: glutathione S-transferase family protein [Caulobacteraceae bacterium]|jgi:glutathione S-transferase|nr:glutathione S-transferase family protein [Caulobacteraceae bacterium]
MITLYAFGSNFGLPDPSPFVMKTEIHLKMAKLGFRREETGPRGAPKGKLPYIDDDGMVVADSVFIRDYLERTYAVDFDAGLTEIQKAQAWTVERMVEDHLYWIMVHARWADEDNFAKGPAHFFDGAPEAMRETIRQQGRQNVISILHGQGIGRHSVEEIAGVAERSFAALARIIGDKPFLTGDRPCGADASVFGLVAGALTPLFDTPVRAAAARHGVLVAYRDRMIERFYPEFAMEMA